MAMCLHYMSKFNYLIQLNKIKSSERRFKATMPPSPIRTPGKGAPSKSAMHKSTEAPLRKIFTKRSETDQYQPYRPNKSFVNFYRGYPDMCENELIAKMPDDVLKSWENMTATQRKNYILESLFRGPIQVPEVSSTTISTNSRP